MKERSWEVLPGVWEGGWEVKYEGIGEDKEGRVVVEGIRETQTGEEVRVWRTYENGRWRSMSFSEALRQQNRQNFRQQEHSVLDEGEEPLVVTSTCLYSTITFMASHHDSQISPHLTTLYVSISNSLTDSLSLCRASIDFSSMHVFWTQIDLPPGSLYLCSSWCALS